MGDDTMELQKLCEDLFCQTGQIGYYLLGCRLQQEEEASQSGTVSTLERYYSAE